MSRGAGEKLFPSMPRGLAGQVHPYECLCVSQRILVAGGRHFGDKMGDINQSCPAETSGISYTPDNVGRAKPGHDG